MVATPAPTELRTLDRRLSTLPRAGAGHRLALAAMAALSVAVLVFVLLPLVLVVLTSFSNDRSIILPVQDWGTAYWERLLLRNQTLQESIRNSLLAAVASAAIATVLATLGVYALQRRYGRLGRFLETFTLLPLLTPLLMYALALVLYYSALDVDGSLVTLVVGHVTVGLPFAYFVVRASMRTISPRQFQAAEDLGASEPAILWQVALPQALPGVVSAFLSVLVLSLNEFIVAFFNSGLAQTLPRFIFSQTARSLTPEVSAASTIVVVFTVLTAALTYAAVRYAVRLRRRAAARAGR